MANSYDWGQRIRCEATFRDTATGAVVDPPTVAFRTNPPSGDNTVHVYGVDPDVIRASAGEYYYDLLLNKSGDWWLRWESTGGNETAREWRVTCCEKKVF